MVFRKPAVPNTMARLPFNKKAMHTVSSKRPVSLFSREKEAPVWLQKASKHISQSLWTGSGKIWQGKGKRLQIRNRAARNRSSSLACSFFVCALFRIKAARYRANIQSHTLLETASAEWSPLCPPPTRIFSLRKQSDTASSHISKMGLCRPVVPTGKVHW